MDDWINGVAEKDRKKVADLYNDAKTIEAKIAVLREWHPRGYLNADPIRSLEEYFKYIRVCATDSTWFRGEARISAVLCRNCIEISIVTVYQNN